MKILHTSDWHLGHRLHEQSQYYEQKQFLKWLVQYINKKNIDVLLVSGDIFDTAYPSNQSLELFYQFLAKLHHHTSCNNIIMIAGNHDAPGTLNAPAHFTRFFNIHLIGKATENLDSEIIEININKEKLIVAASPFLRDRDIRRTIAGENANDIENRYRKALINHYQKLANKIKQKYNATKIINIAMGHLFATETKTSESEKRIYIGGLGDIAAKDFPSVFDYIALGHLHRPQIVGKKHHIRYSGSPYPLSFSESTTEKKIIILSTANNEIKNIEEIKVPIFRKLYRIKGNLEECLQELEKIGNHKEKIEPWVEINLLEKKTINNIYQIINEYVINKPIKILSIRKINTQIITDITHLEEKDRELNELKADEIFKKKCKEQGFNLNENPEILDAFYEILNEIEE